MYKQIKISNILSNFVVTVVTKQIFNAKAETVIKIKQKFTGIRLLPVLTELEL